MESVHTRNTNRLLVQDSVPCSCPVCIKLRTFIVSMLETPYYNLPYCKIMSIEFVLMLIPAETILYKKLCAILYEHYQRKSMEYHALHSHFFGLTRRSQAPSVFRNIQNNGEVKTNISAQDFSKNFSTESHTVRTQEETRTHHISFPHPKSYPLKRKMASANQNKDETKKENIEMKENTKDSSQQKMISRSVDIDSTNEDTQDGQDLDRYLRNNPSPPEPLATSTPKK